MKYNAGASYLTEELWNSTATFLDPFVPQLSSFAKAHSFDFETNIRWPAIEWSKRNLGRLTVYRLALNSNYLEDNRINFELVRMCFKVGLLGRRMLEEKNTLAVYGELQIKNVSNVCLDIENKVVDLMRG